MVGVSDLVRMDGRVELVSTGLGLGVRVRGGGRGRCITILMLVGTMAVAVGGVAMPGMAW